MGTTRILVHYSVPEVEHMDTYVSYDLLSLIGEIGGILGLTLGASGMSVVVTLLTYLVQINPKKIVGQCKVHSLVQIYHI